LVFGQAGLDVSKNATFTFIDGLVRELGTAPTALSDGSDSSSNNGGVAGASMPAAAAGGKAALFPENFFQCASQVATRRLLRLTNAHYTLTQLARCVTVAQLRRRRGRHPLLGPAAGHELQYYRQLQLRSRYLEVAAREWEPQQRWLSRYGQLQPSDYAALSGTYCELHNNRPNLPLFPTVFSGDSANCPCSE
jgi:hypothetical protein